jgi:hypothetical protein
VVVVVVVVGTGEGAAEVVAGTATTELESRLFQGLLGHRGSPQGAETLTTASFASPPTTTSAL